MKKGTSGQDHITICKIEDETPSRDKNRRLNRNFLSIRTDKEIRSVADLL